MAIIRKVKNKNQFVMIPRKILNDKTISLGAKGLSCFIDYILSDTIIIKESLTVSELLDCVYCLEQDNREDALLYIKELEDAGYISVK